MKKIIHFSFFVLFFVSKSIAQSNSDVAKYAQIMHYELQENKIFYEFNRSNNSVESDTAFIASKGFLFNELIKRRIGEENYIILTFPDFTGRTQIGKIVENNEQKVFVEFAGDDLGAVPEVRHTSCSVVTRS